MQPKFVAAQKMLLKQKTQQHCNGLLGFITLGELKIRAEARGQATLCMSCPSIWATLSALLINILLGSFQRLHSDQLSSEGEIIPFSGVCQSGGGCIIHAEAVVASTH